ncbi:MAG: DUF411 domain-containing protein [Alphaproteobacteria bacterium]|nr:DUF411 domain-containing protein [Rhodospirillales bacterium]MCW9044935.1 DUF411 domain-containing protein [Alphaproteobacteria bacterium]
MANYKILLIGFIAVIGVAGFSWMNWQVRAPAQIISQANAGELVVYKSPSCGCCGDWVDHLKQSGFKVQVHDTDEMTAVKNHFKVPHEMGSCHTATVNGYVVEGHVPANDIKRLLSEKPNVRGIAVPGMPIGSPGMEQGDEKEAYQVIAFGEKGFKVFAQY